MAEISVSGIDILYTLRYGDVLSARGRRAASRLHP